MEKKARPVQWQHQGIPSEGDATPLALTVRTAPSRGIL
jgi:hypothetical protein